MIRLLGMEHHRWGEEKHDAYVRRRNFMVAGRAQIRLNATASVTSLQAHQVAQRAASFRPAIRAQRRSLDGAEPLRERARVPLRHRGWLRERAAAVRDVVRGAHRGALPRCRDALRERQRERPDGPRYTYDCTSSSSVVVDVDADKLGVVDLCEPFWNLSMTGEESQAGLPISVVHGLHTYTHCPCITFGRRGDGRVSVCGVD